MDVSIGRRWAMLLISFSALIGVFIPYVGQSTQLASIIEDLGISHTQAGLFGSVTALLGGIVLPFAGVLVEKWGAKKIIIIGLIISIISQIMFAYMPTYSLMVLAKAIGGIGVGLLFVGPYTLAVQWFEDIGNNGLALGVMFSSDGVGTAFAVYLYAYVFLIMDWRNGMAVGGLFLFLILLITIFLLKEPSNFQRDNKESYSSGSSDKVGFNDYIKVLTTKNALVAVSFFVAEWGIYAVVGNWAPTIFIEGAGWSESLAGFMTSLYALIGIIPAIIFGFISDKLGKRKPFFVIAALWMTLSVTLTAIALANEAFIATAIFMMFIGVGVYTGMPIILALATETVGSRRIGLLNGIVLGTGFLVGGFVYPAVIGYVKDITGAYNKGFIGIAIATFILAFLVSLFAEDVKTSDKPEEEISS